MEFDVLQIRKICCYTNATHEIEFNRSERRFTECLSVTNHDRPVDKAMKNS